jgi:hypothetical protein
MPNFDNFVYFVLERNSNASYSFTGYSDPHTGEIKAYYIGKKDPKSGEDIPFRFKFDKAHRAIRAGIHEQDINGLKKIDFLRGFPECKDSPNGHYRNGKQVNVWYRELNDYKDAELAVEAKKMKIEAEKTALDLEGIDLKEMALLCGEQRDDVGLMKHRVLEAAGAHPENFLSLYNMPERKAKVLLIQALQANVITKRGSIFVWENVTIGTNENAAIAKLMEDDTLTSAIKENLGLVSEPPTKKETKKKDKDE